MINHGLGQVISQSFVATEESFPNPRTIFGLRSAFENAAALGATGLGTVDALTFTHALAGR